MALRRSAYSSPRSLVSVLSMIRCRSSLRVESSSSFRHSSICVAMSDDFGSCCSGATPRRAASTLHTRVAARSAVCARRLEFGVQYQDVEFVKLVDDFFALIGHGFPIYMDTMSNIDSLAQDQPEKRLHAGIRKKQMPRPSWSGHLIVHHHNNYLVTAFFSREPAEIRTP